jgi:sterol desaturase/sphingolipid hydroxylase (fatty acid hydroxylase superfamily)
VLIFRILGVALVLLLIGDLIATFLYHVPEHVFGKYHLLIHHSPNRSFIRYAITNRKPQALVSGFFGFTPYLILIPCLWQLSPLGVILGLLLAEFHLIWRHSYQEEKGTRTPQIIDLICQKLCITTPERHWQHHLHIDSAYGDIFTFYDLPAQSWQKLLTNLRQKLKFSNY